MVGRSGSSWHWSWNNGIDYIGGGLTFPAGDNAVGKTCHPSGCGQLIVQPQNPTHGNGYTQAQVNDNGPNHGGLYITAVTVDARMASALNPEYLAGGTLRQTSQCIPYVQLSFWDFNRATGLGCGGGGTAWGDQFLSWASGHEEGHALNVVSFINQYSFHDARRGLEELAFMTTTEIQNEASNIVTKSGQCTTAAAATHVGFSSPGFDIWFWSATQGAFYRWPASSSPWWPSDPVPSTCLTS